MTEISIVGIDLAKRVFQIHAAAVDGAVVLRRKLTRAQVLPFLAKLSPCTVAMEACATAHHWGREIARLGHAVRLIPPIYVKPFVKRHKNDAADAEAIVEAAIRPNMRFVAVKSEAQQAGAMVFRPRDLLVRQRTQLVNALRGHLAEYGIVAAQGTAHLKVLQAELDARGPELPAPVQEVARLYLDQIAHCAEKIAGLEKSIRAQAAAGTTTARLQTMPGIGPIAAMAIDAFAPPMQEFRRGRDFAAWLGLVPRQQSTGGKQVLGRTSKMGQRDIRRLLIIGAMAVVRAAVRRGVAEESWLGRMLARKPRMVVAIALANKMARAAWAMQTKEEIYRGPLAA
jgi:transposase